MKKKKKRDLVVLWIERATKNKLKEVAAKENKSMIELLETLTSLLK